MYIDWLPGPTMRDTPRGEFGPPSPVPPMRDTPRGEFGPPSPVPPMRDTPRGEFGPPSPVPPMRDTPRGEFGPPSPVPPMRDTPRGEFGPPMPGPPMPDTPRGELPRPPAFTVPAPCLRCTTTGPPEDIDPNTLQHLEVVTLGQHCPVIVKVKMKDVSMCMDSSQPWFHMIMEMLLL
ncbi:uncharacterized protein LOC130130878 [Lampris incognitus]|uniref:uncharacterized protein LOC130130878 n=1 Tax=Lampris incognitus TaxID=2546036 RepID=UPI0024B62950|nr:uncharacterized protein LOC130130878 [Lampris incognitus]